MGTEVVVFVLRAVLLRRGDSDVMANGDMCGGRGWQGANYRVCTLVLAPTARWCMTLGPVVRQRQW